MSSVSGGGFRYAREGIERAARALERLTVRRPALGVALSGWLGAASTRDPEARKTPTAGEARRLFGRLPVAEARRLRRAIASQGYRNRVLRRLVAEKTLTGALPLVERVEAGPLPRLRETGSPMVLVGWHQGPIFGATLGLLHLGLPGLAAATVAHEGGDGCVRFRRVAQDGSDVPFLKEALEELQAGGAVVTHLDWKTSRGHTVTVLGRPIRIARGPAFLARTAGARLVPVTRRWRGLGGGIEITFHEPLSEPTVSREDGSAWDAAQLEIAAAWFDTHLRRNPDTLRNDRIRFLRASAPPATRSDPARSRAAP